MTEFRRWAALEAVRDAVGASLGDPAGRLRLQVGVLLLEVLGVALGYRFQRGGPGPASADLLADAITAARARARAVVRPDPAALPGLADQLPRVAGVLAASPPSAEWPAALGWAHWYGYWCDWDPDRTQAAVLREQPACAPHAAAAIAALRRLGAWGRV